jgi:hypothetical protein
MTTLPVLKRSSEVSILLNNLSDAFFPHDYARCRGKELIDGG